MSKIILTDEGATPATPSAGTTVVYTQAGVLYTLTSSGTPVAPLSLSIFTATGQMIYASAPGTAAALTIGTAGQYLRVNAGATAPEWFSLLGATVPTALGGAGAAGSSASAARVDHVHAFPVSATGDLLYASGATTVTNLGIGAGGQFLRVNAGIPDWQTVTAGDVGAVALSTVTAAGDLIYATGAGAVTRRGIGTVGQVLAVNSGATAPVWQNPPTFVAGSATSTAQYKGTGSEITGIAAAIAAASAAGGGVVVILPGFYSGGGTTLTLPANVSLAAAGGIGSVAIQADVTCTAPTGSGPMSVSGLYISGSFTFDTAGVVDGTQFFFNDCQIETGSASAITIVDNGWDLTLTNCAVKVTAPAFDVVTGPADPDVADLTADNCQFVSTVGGVGVRTFNGSFNSVNLTGCYLSHPVDTTTVAGSNISVRDCTLNFAPNTPTTAFSFAAGASTLVILGSFPLINLTGAGTLYTGGAVSALVSPGTFIGTYQFLNLPTLAGGDGVLAYTSDENALYVLRSGAWEKVASASNATTWTATQTFNETVFNRAATATAVNTGTATYTMASNTVSPLIRMDTASGSGAKTVTLFTPDAGGADNGKQWVIFDALRNAGSGPEPIDIAVPGGVTINGGAGPYTSAISTDGGAIVVRVVGANAWETIGY